MFIHYITKYYHWPSADWRQ